MLSAWLFYPVSDSLHEIKELVSKSVLFMLVVFICSSCNVKTLPPEIIAQTAVPLWNSPIPKPKYVENVDHWHGNLMSRMCLNLNEVEVWEPGEFGTTYDRVRDTGSVEVDGIPMRDVIFPQLTVSLARFDAFGQTIGTHGGGIGICFNIRDLSNGWHVANVSFRTKSGSIKSYSWAFQTKIKVGQVVPELPTLP